MDDTFPENARLQPGPVVTKAGLELGAPRSAPRGWHSRGYMPHFDSHHVVQHVTFHLADSLPADILVLDWDAVDHDPYNPYREEGRDGLKKVITMYRSAFPDLQFTIEDQIAEGDKVVTRWVGTGTHQGDDLGFAASGNAVHFNGMTIGRIENGKLVEGWNVFDQLGMLQQCGVVNLPAAS